jgi:hypothetical protein
VNKILCQLIEVLERCRRRRCRHAGALAAEHKQILDVSGAAT